MRVYVLTKLYSAFIYLLLPLLWFRLLLKSRTRPQYWDRWWQRFGLVPRRGDRPLCIHAVSVGEVRSIIPFVKLVKANHPDLPIIITTMTPTGAEQVRLLAGEDAEHYWLPYDAPWCVRRFLNRVNPRAILFIETEIWPNFLVSAAKLGIPSALVNARMTRRSSYGYERYLDVIRPGMMSFNKLLARTQDDADRLVRLGARPERVFNNGDIKFDLDLPEFDADVSDDWLKQKQRGIWLAASTHEGEEEVIIEWHRRLREVMPKLLLMIAPRHPERFDAVAELLEEKNTSFSRRSVTNVPQSDDAVYLIDTLGELMRFYSLSDVALVAGSVLAYGGHNPVEPASLAVPILSGPRIENFEVMFDDLQQCGGAFVGDLDELPNTLVQLLSEDSTRKQMAESAKQWYESQRGATQRVYDHCKDWLA